MIPTLAWIANSAPEKLKAIYFAVMAAFVNLALSLSQLLTKMLNQWFVVTREVRDVASGAVIVPADYSQLGTLFWTVLALSLAPTSWTGHAAPSTRFPGNQTQSRNIGINKTLAAGL